LALTRYLDTSVVAALFVTDDAFTERATRFVATDEAVLVVSDFGAAEFASVIARLARSDRLAREIATSLFADFDVWLGRAVQRVEAMPADIARAAAFIRRLDLNLRTPDALHIAIADRLGVALATFDMRMAANAAALGVATATL
jgi:hypothetical protein